MTAGLVFIDAAEEKKRGRMGAGRAYTGRFHKTESAQCQGKHVCMREQYVARGSRDLKNSRLQIKSDFLQAVIILYQRIESVYQLAKIGLPKIAICD